MKTLLKLCPSDHGRPISLDEFEHATHEEGHHYELIRGRIYVSPVPNLPQDSLEVWIGDLLREYRRKHPEIINHVTNKGRVFVPGEEELTAPEPDVAAYRHFPHHQPLGERRWQQVSPVLVVEVVGDDDPDKDFVRNVELYLLVSSIREYWIIDGRHNPDQPSFRIYRRRGQCWQKPIDLVYGDTYETRLLPGFTLVIDPLR